MRTVEEIRADLPRVAFATDMYVATRKSEQQYEIELRAAITTNIPIDRLKSICAAERDVRLVTLPVPAPDLVSVTRRGVAAAVKLAVTLRALSMLTVQLLVPVQAPLQPVNVLPDVDCAAKVTDVPAA